MPSPFPAVALFRPPSEPTDSDADLVARFVTDRDEAAFAALVRRHGPMVLAVCRRRNRQSADAEDVFQAVFLALARDAGKIARREAVGGWLYRVAYFLSGKLAGRAARQRPAPLTVEPSAAMPDPDFGDLKSVLDHAIAGLSDKLRAVAVACLVEGRTNADVARLLGIPIGTVDSRLNAARQQLRDRLARRGIAVTTVAAMEVALSAETSAAASRVAALAESVVSNALAYAAGMSPAGLEPVSSLADGVTTMTTFSITRRLLAGLLCASILGGAGWGVYTATAQDKDAEPAKAKAEPKPKAPAELEAALVKAPVPPKAETPNTSDQVQAMLNKYIAVPPGANDIAGVIGYLANDHKMTVRFDTAAFVRRGVEPEILQQMREKKLQLPIVDKLPAGDLLREALAQLAMQAAGEGNVNLRLSYRIRGSQVLIVPEFRPATVPGAAAVGDVQSMLTPEQLAETIYGEPVTLRIKNKAFAEVLDDLRDLTGANIVVDARTKEKADAKVTATFNDARLFTVLKVLGDSCEMRPVVMDNVYYLTTPENATKLQKEINRDLFGDPPPPIQPGGLGGGLGGGVPRRR